MTILPSYTGLSTQGRHRPPGHPGGGNADEAGRDTASVQGEAKGAGQAAKTT